MDACVNEWRLMNEIINHACEIDPFIILSQSVIITNCHISSPSIVHPCCIMTEQTPILVVFGRPGAGKTTIATASIEAMNKSDKNDSLVVHGLDLDACVPQWMRDNFVKGIYPTLEQRKKFASDCCDYVRKELKEMPGAAPDQAIIISFSFVNTDLRDVFRSSFPKATWILIDTSKEEATRRIDARQDHFYKSSESASVEKEETKTTKADVDNSDWNFAPVTFDHILLHGNQPINVNVEKIVQVLVEKAGLPIYWN
jgi:gluconate kinase